MEQEVGGSSPPNCTKGIRLPAVPLLDHLEGKSQAPADLTAEYLNLAPSQHTEETFKATLGSCQNVVNSLGTLRNKIEDAHGQGRKPIRPSKRHAALAVNLAEAMATFLVQTRLEPQAGS